MKSTKKLKKVMENNEIEKLSTSLNAKMQSLNIAYKKNDGVAIDKATHELSEFFETTILKDTDYHLTIKNHTWQRNHLKVLASISDLLQEKNRMPTNTEISLNAGLSEETVYKHLKEFKSHPLYAHEADKFLLMKHRILAKVFNLGVQGDIKACRVFLENFPEDGNSTKKNLTQTNYIQINQIKITQDNIKYLNAEQLNTIETILKTALPQPTLAEEISI